MGNKIEIVTIQKKDESKQTPEVRTNTVDEEIYGELKEAEIEMNSITKRYFKEELLQSMNDIMG